VCIDDVIWHFELCWLAVLVNHQTMDHSNLFLFLSLCCHFTFTWTVAITGVRQIEYFSLHSCSLLTFWIAVPLLHVWELLVGSSDSCQPENLNLCRNMWVTSILRQLYILIISYIFFWTWQELYFQNLYLNLPYLSNRGFTFFLLLAVWLMLEGLQHFWNFSVVFLVALSAVLNCGKNVY
jgi:hypothetical protein